MQYSSQHLHLTNVTILLLRVIHFQKRKILMEHSVQKIQDWSGNRQMWILLSEYKIKVWAFFSYIPVFMEDFHWLWKHKFLIKLMLVFSSIWVTEYSLIIVKTRSFTSVLKNSVKRICTMLLWSNMISFTIARETQSQKNSCVLE